MLKESEYRFFKLGIDYRAFNQRTESSNRL